METHLTVVSIGLNKDPFETRLDVMDVVIVLWLQRAERGGGTDRVHLESQGPVMKLRQLTRWSGLGSLRHLCILSCGTLCYRQLF